MRSQSLAFSTNVDMIRATLFKPEKKKEFHSHQTSKFDHIDFQNKPFTWLFLFSRFLQPESNRFFFKDSKMGLGSMIKPSNSDKAPEGASADDTE